MPKYLFILLSIYMSPANAQNYELYSQKVKSLPPVSSIWMKCDSTHVTLNQKEYNSTADKPIYSRYFAISIENLYIAEFDPELKDYVVLVESEFSEKSISGYYYKTQGFGGRHWATTSDSIAIDRFNLGFERDKLIRSSDPTSNLTESETGTCKKIPGPPAPRQKQF